MADYYIDSSNIEIYPTTKRSTTFDTDNYSKLNYEPNVANLDRNIVDRSNYIISGCELSYESGVLTIQPGHCMIYGHIITIKDVQTISVAVDKIVEFRLQLNNQVVDGGDSSGDYTSFSILVQNSSYVPYYAGELILCHISAEGELEENILLNTKYSLNNISIENEDHSISNTSTKTLFYQWLGYDLNWFIVNDLTIDSKDDERITIIYNDGTYIKLKNDIKNDTKNSLNKSDLINKENILSLYIPTTITTMDADVFEGCTNLKYLTLPFIGQTASNRCTLPEMFNTSAGNLKVKYVKLLPNSIYNHIETDTFKDIITLEKVVLPNTITRLASQSFSGCSNLSNINIPSSIYEIWDRAFENCSSLVNIDLPDSITGLGTETFKGSGIQSLYLGPSITRIGGNNGSGLCKDCTNLQSVILNYTSTSRTPMCVITRQMFSGCTNLTSIEINSPITEIWRNAFDGCVSLTNIVIPDSVTVLGNYVFNGCTSLDEITLSNNITSIGEYCFYNCESLTSMHMPAQINEIGDYALYGCVSLNYIKFYTVTITPSAVPKLLPNNSDSNALSNTNDCEIRVTNILTRNAFRNAWPQYAERIVVG